MRGQYPEILIVVFDLKLGYFKTRFTIVGGNKPLVIQYTVHGLC
jgi:hypothetical protein